jgi:hypothetical protein
MTPPAAPRFQASIQSREEVPEPIPGTPPAADAPVVHREVELAGTVERGRDGRPGWNTASLLDALVELHNPSMENP